MHDGMHGAGTVLRARMCRHRGSDAPAPMRPFYVPEASTWTMPFVMEGVNARIVQYSAALVRGSPPGSSSTGTGAASSAYGRDFKYREAVAASGPVVAALASAGMGLLGMAMLAPPMRGLLSRCVQAPASV